MRLVSQALDQALTATPNAPVNFGLMFNKFLQYQQSRQNRLEPEVKDNRKPLIDEYRKSQKHTAEILKQRHLQQSAYCRTMEQAGWHALAIHARLTAPFVSGLGMSHPTETGLVLDHTSGVPYIPASSQKGVLRVAHLINSLCDESGQWLSEEELQQNGVIHAKGDGWEWIEDDFSKALFGFGGEKKSLAGQLVALDAYPLEPPNLSEEILNPHFADYYQQKNGRNGRKRGPTEDQSPIPIKFLVVKPGTEFVFRLLLRTPFDRTQKNDQSVLIDWVERNLRRAITEEGMGAKTALGFGRFAIQKTGEPVCVEDWLKKYQDDEEARKYPWRPTVRAIEAAADWGQLKQLLSAEKAKKYQAEPEVGQAMVKIASRIRSANIKKWDRERDQQIAEWLNPSGMTWTLIAPVTDGPEKSQCSPEEQAALEQIEMISDWGAWKGAGIEMASLPPAALAKLKAKLKEWKCDHKKAKEDKRAAWNEVNRLIRGN